MNTSGWECLHGVLVELFGSKEAIILGPELICGLKTTPTPPRSLTCVLKALAEGPKQSNHCDMDRPTDQLEAQAEVIPVISLLLHTQRTAPVHRGMHTTVLVNELTTRHAGGWLSSTLLKRCNTAQSLDSWHFNTYRALIVVVVAAEGSLLGYTAIDYQGSITWVWPSEQLNGHSLFPLFTCSIRSSVSIYAVVMLIHFGIPYA